MKSRTRSRARRQGANKSQSTQKVPSGRGRPNTDAPRKSDKKQPVSRSRSRASNSAAKQRTRSHRKTTATRKKPNEYMVFISNNREIVKNKVLSSEKFASASSYRVNQEVSKQLHAMYEKTKNTEKLSKGGKNDPKNDQRDESDNDDDKNDRQQSSTD